MKGPLSTPLVCWWGAAGSSSIWGRRYNRLCSGGLASATRPLPLVNSTPSLDSYSAGRGGSCGAPPLGLTAGPTAQQLCGAVVPCSGAGTAMEWTQPRVILWRARREGNAQRKLLRRPWTIVMLHVGVISSSVLTFCGRPHAHSSWLHLHRAPAQDQACRQWGSLTQGHPLPASLRCCIPELFLQRLRHCQQGPLQPLCGDQPHRPAVCPTAPCSHRGAHGKCWGAVVRHRSCPPHGPHLPVVRGPWGPPLQQHPSARLRGWSPLGQRGVCTGKALHARGQDKCRFPLLWAQLERCVERAAGTEVQPSQQQWAPS